MGDAVLAIERLAALRAASGPQAVDDRRIEEDADLNVGGDEDGIFRVRRSDGSEVGIFVDDAASRGGTEEIVAVDAFEKGGVVQQEGSNGFFFEVDELLAILFGGSGIGGGLFICAGLRASRENGKKSKEHGKRNNKRAEFHEWGPR